MDAADLSPAALQVARINIRKYQLGKRVRALRSDLLQKTGKYDVIVANPRRVALIYGDHTKSDENDEKTLAKLGRMDPELLSPLRHRGAETLADRAFLTTRTALVRSRARLLQVARGIVKSHGQRLPLSSVESFQG